jgi:hypothetical protein
MNITNKLGPNPTTDAILRGSDCPLTDCSLLVLPSNPRPKSDWHVVIEVDHQSFVLAYTAEDKQDANWMASMLQIALEKCGTRISPANSPDRSSRSD